MKSHAVISGVGVAGPAVALRLGALGWQPAVIERYLQRRDEGQNIDVRGEHRRGRDAVPG